MKQCPYNLHIEQVSQEQFEYTENGLVSLRQQKLIENQKSTPCAGKNCGAYRFGRCIRRSG